MHRIIALTLLAVGVQTFMFGAVPEIDPGSGANALALIGGAIIVYRGRRRN